MPLYLVRVSRLVEVVEYGDFSIEADNHLEAQEKAKAALKGKPDINWEQDRERGEVHPIRIQEVEDLATGTEDIREQFG
jgi:hypothetical protein